MKQTITVKSKIKKFIPQFLENTKNDIELLKKSLQAKNYDEIHRNAHSMKGYAKPFGFGYLGELAAQLQQAAKDQAFEDAESLIEELDEYYDNIEIVYS
ncbi:Hpt domain-containing protein [Candidatus Magnetomorum sp. HK-1]|nr:Hpt domain-containing protein [Candidatus Magnetomorum sp. HK-1]